MVFQCWIAFWGHQGLGFRVLVLKGLKDFVGVHLSCGGQHLISSRGSYI